MQFPSQRLQEHSPDITDTIHVMIRKNSSIRRAWQSLHSCFSHIPENNHRTCERHLPKRKLHFGWASGFRVLFRGKILSEVGQNIPEVACEVVFPSGPRGEWAVALPAQIWNATDQGSLFGDLPGCSRRAVLQFHHRHPDVCGHGKESNHLQGNFAQAFGPDTILTYAVTGLA